MRIICHHETLEPIMNRVNRVNLKALVTILTLLLLPLAIIPAIVSADTLLIPDVDTSENRPEFPQNGLTMATVRQQFGEPLKEHPPIGEPPITRWGYQNYTVFFENNQIITTVQKPQKTADLDKFNN